MKNNNNRILDNLVNRILTETLEERADELTAKLRHRNEMNELGGMDDGHPRFGKMNMSKLSPEEIDRMMNSLVEPTDDYDDEDYDTEDYDTEDDDYQGNWVHPLGEDDSDDETGYQVCNECGYQMNECICNECGNSYAMMDEDDEVLGHNEDELFDPSDSSNEENVEGCKAVREVIKLQDGDITDLDRRTMKNYNCKSLMESLTDKQRKNIDKNKNGKIDSEDFRLLHKKKKDVNEDDVEEGNEFTGELAKAKKEGKKEFEVGGKKYKVKESENNLKTLIGNIVKEEKLKRLGEKPKGLSTYEKSHNGSGKENKEYLNSVAKKMTDYLKDGSKGKYDTNPKHFPKGNGELGKMNKKAFSMTDELEDYNYGIAGLNIPTPDAIEFNEDFMDKLYTGDSTTGNKPGGNALESEANERFNKIRKKNPLKKLKDQSYKRVSSPVFNEKSGDEQGKGLNIKLESVEKSQNLLNEEFNRINELLKYNRKTQ